MNSMFISRHDNQCTLNDIKCFACLRSISFVVPVLDLTKNSSLHILTTLDCCHFMYCCGMFPPKSLLNLLPLLRIKKFLAEKASIFVFPVVWKDIKWLRRGDEVTPILPDLGNPNEFVPFLVCVNVSSTLQPCIHVFQTFWKLNQNFSTCRS